MAIGCDGRLHEGVRRPPWQASSIRNKFACAAARTVSGWSLRPCHSLAQCGRMLRYWPSRSLYSAHLSSTAWQKGSQSSCLTLFVVSTSIEQVPWRFPKKGAMTTFVSPPTMRISMARRIAPLLASVHATLIASHHARRQMSQSGPPLSFSGIGICHSKSYTRCGRAVMGGGGWVDR